MLFLDKKNRKYRLGKFVSYDDSRDLRGPSDKILYFGEYASGQL